MLLAYSGLELQLNVGFMRTLAWTLAAALLNGCGGAASGQAAPAEATPEHSTAAGDRGGRAFYCHDLHIELRDGKRIELSSCSENLRDCEQSRTSLGGNTDVSKNVAGTCRRAATAECFSQPGRDGRAGYFCARTLKQCGLRRIIQSAHSPAGPCVTAVPGRTTDGGSGAQERQGSDDANESNIWYCFEHDASSGDENGPGFPVCFARKGECQSIRGRLTADHRAVTRCAMNRGAHCVPIEAEGRTELVCTASADDCAVMREKMAAGGTANVPACSPARGCGDPATPCPH